MHINPKTNEEITYQFLWNKINEHFFNQDVDIDAVINKFTKITGIDFRVVGIKEGFEGLSEFYDDESLEDFIKDI